MPNILTLTRFGNPVLRKANASLTEAEIKSDKIQKLIADMRHTIHVNKLGVGLAATQVGHNIRLSVISAKATANKPGAQSFDTVIINPKIVQTYGERQPLWEGCISCGMGNDTLFGQVPRYKKIKLQWIDENAVSHEKVLTGFVAQIAQHEVDHLDGILFVERVEDPKTYMMADEYFKRATHKN